MAPDITADGDSRTARPSDKIRDLIIDKKPTSEIKRAAYEEGMTSLRESAVSKVLSGETTLREINKVTFIE
jgi:type IV pilus assembly protein PilB